MSGGGATGVGIKRNAWKTKFGKLARVGVIKEDEFEIVQLNDFIDP